MHINTNSINIKVSPSTKAFINNALGGIYSRFDSLVGVDVILSKTKVKHSVEINTLFEGKQISVRGSGENLFKSIRAATVKLNKSLASRKGQLLAKRKSKSVTDESELAHEHIQNLALS